MFAWITSCFFSSFLLLQHFLTTVSLLPFLVVFVSSFLFLFPLNLWCFENGALQRWHRTSLSKCYKYHVHIENLQPFLYFSFCTINSGTQGPYDVLDNTTGATGKEATMTDILKPVDIPKMTSRCATEFSCFLPHYQRDASSTNEISKENEALGDFDAPKTSWEEIVKGNLWK